MNLETIRGLRDLLDKMETCQLVNDQDTFFDLESDFHKKYMQGQFNGFFDLTWKEWEKEQPNAEMMEVLAFSEQWIDLDFNLVGIRVGFVDGEGQFCSAEWVDYHDCYQESTEDTPSHWMPFPVFQKPNTTV